MIFSFTPFSPQGLRPFFGVLRVLLREGGGRIGLRGFSALTSWGARVEVFAPTEDTLLSLDSVADQVHSRIVLRRATGLKGESKAARVTRSSSKSIARGDERIRDGKGKESRDDRKNFA